MSEDDHDEGLFRREMADVRPLRRDDRLQPAPRRRRPAVRAEHQQILLEEPWLSPFDALLETGEELLFRHPSLSPRVFRKLRRGEFAVEDELDLHGLNVKQAHEVLATFVNRCSRYGLSCVRVIHGKGRGSGPRGPVLKTEVDRWLRRWEDVLGFASAPPHDGGTGAVYVLLRRK